MKKTGWSNVSRHKRGYGSLWDRIRKIVLQRDNGLCQCDECKGGAIRLLPANEVHHIKPKAEGGTDALDNLQAINPECHKRETAKQQGRVLKPKIQIGVDGWPIR